MKLIILSTSIAALAFGCAASPRPKPAPDEPVPAAYQIQTVDRPASDDRYDQPGGLPADSGGTDAGRLGTDQRYLPVR